jgi:peptide deformylase
MKKELVPIVTYKNSRLNRKCFQTITTAEDASLFYNAVKEVFQQYNAVGVAAPQLGYSLRAIGVTNPVRSTGSIKVMLNPVIIESKGELESIEGCLSIPGVFGKVKRHAYIKVAYQNTLLQDVEEDFIGLEAAVVQHEIDHLDGILFVTKATDIKFSDDTIC